MSGKQEVHTEWEEKVHPYHLPMHVFTNLETVNEKLLKMNQILNDADMDDTGYVDQSSEIEMVGDGIGKLNAYVGSLISTAGSKLDDPLYKAFDQGATENLSRIKMENYSTENTLGIKEHYILPEDDGIQQIGYDVLKDKLTLDDFLGLTGLKKGGTEGSVFNIPDEFKDFTDMFALDYNGIKAELIDSDGVQIGLEEYLKEISTLGEYDHQMDKPGLNFLSSLLDITIVKPLYEACTGYDIITGEDLSDMERGLKVIFAVIDVVTLGTGMAVTKLAGQGTKGVLKFAAKTMVVDAVSFAVSYGVSEAGEALGLPLPLTLVLSLGAGVTMSRQLGKYVFKDSTGKVILESNADEVDAVLKGTGGAKGKGAFNGDVTNGVGFGKLDGKEIGVSQKGLDQVKKHISSNGFEAPENTEMIKRIEDALNKGEKLSGADASYYMHELKESTLMNNGLSYDEAHIAALETYEVSPFSVYHPDIILKNPSAWGKPWFKFWGIKK